MPVMPTNDDPRRVGVFEVFRHALDLEGAARDRYVDGAFADLSDGAAMAREVRALLARADTVGDIGDFDAAPPPPAAVGDYRLIRCIGAGGFGEVWLGRNDVDHLLYAVKLIRPGRHVELQGIQRYRECTAEHPHLLPVLHVGMAEGRYYTVMPLADAVDGTAPDRNRNLDDYEPLTLARHLEDHGPLSSDEALGTALDLLAGLEHLHQQSVFHADVKPSNVLRHRDLWRLGDHGMVTSSDADRSRGFSPLYAPPEGVTGAAADLYAVGVMLFEMLTGQSPGALPAFRAADESEPAARRELVLKATDPDRSCRFASAGEFIRAASNIREGRPPEERRIGAFRILDEIGQGATSRVFRALQEDPRREVALKILRRDAVSRQAMKRFEYESQVLARLNHPGIAQVYFAGKHDEGAGAVPFFAMELLEGATSITAFESARDVDGRARVELFAAVCEAVGYGHRNLVIHRDLKPSNILVTPDGRPKVIDFGFARMTNATESMFLEESRHFAGTLAYASPEQCDCDVDRLTTSSDVYALGVILYEIVCGCRPLAFEDLSLTSVVRRIREDQPPAPRTLDAAVDPDLEAVILKALEKDPVHRYGSATDLARDLRRYVAGEPVEARSPSVVRQARQLARRRPAAAVAVLVGPVAIAVLVGLVTTLMQASDARSERDIALHHAYAGALITAENALTRGDTSTADFSLRSLPESQARLGGWEWTHLDSRTHLDRRDMTLTLGDGSPIRAVQYDPRNGLITVRMAAPEREYSRFVVLDGTREVISLVGCSAAVTADGRLLFTSDEATVDVRSRDRLDAPRPVLDVGSDYIAFILTHPSQPLIAAAENRGVVHLWRMSEDGDLVALAKSPGIGPPEVFVLGMDGRCVMLADGDGEIGLWRTADLVAGRPDPTIVPMPGYKVIAAAFEPGGSLMATGSADGRIVVWDLAAWIDGGQPVLRGQWEGRASVVLGLAFDPTGRFLHSSGQDGVIRTWMIDDRDARIVADCVAELRGHDNAVRGLAVLPGGRLVTGDDQGRLRFWNTFVEDIATPIGPQQSITSGHASSVRGVAFLEDGKYVVTGAGDGTLTVWDFARGTQVARRLRNPIVLNDMAACRASAMAATVDDERVELWDLRVPETPERIDVIEAAPNLLCVAFAHDGGRLAACSETVSVWDIGQTARPKATFGAAGVVSDASFLDPAGVVLVTAGEGDGGNGGALNVWDVDAGQPAQPIIRLPAPARSVAYDSNSGRLAVGCVDGRILLFDVARDRRVGLEPSRVLTGHASSVFALAWHPDDDRLFSGSGDTTIRVWDPGSGVTLAILHGHAGNVTDLAFSPDGRTLASTSAGRFGSDNAVKFWEIDRAHAETRALTRRVAFDIIRPLQHRGSVADPDRVPPTFDEGLAEIRDADASWYRGLDAEYVSRLQAEAERCWRERWSDPWWLYESALLLAEGDADDRARARHFADAVCELEPWLRPMVEAELKARFAPRNEKPGSQGPGLGR